MIRINRTDVDHVSAGPPVEQAGRDRYLYIDGLRGAAALMVLLFHLYRPTEFASLGKIVPYPLHFVLRHGWLGVDVFFVLSGFVIAYSVAGAHVTARYLGNFALRRSIRLDPPYWATIAIVIVINSLSNLAFGEHGVSPTTWGRLLAHLFYVYPLFDYPGFVGVFWTLCHEVQFYLLFILLLGVAQRLPRLGRQPSGGASPAGLVLCLGVPALLSAATPYRVNGLCLHTWYEFCLGAFAYWMYVGRIPKLVYLAYVACVFAMPWGDHGAPRQVALVTAVSLVAAAWSGNLTIWLSGRILQYLGRVSYSLYLIHNVIGGRILRLGFRLTGDSLFWALAWFGLAVAASFLAAELMCRFIEMPSIRFARRFKPARSRAPQSVPARDEPRQPAWSDTVAVRASGLGQDPQDP